MGSALFGRVFFLRRRKNVNDENRPVSSFVYSIRGSNKVKIVFTSPPRGKLIFSVRNNLRV